MLNVIIPEQKTINVIAPERKIINVFKGGQTLPGASGGATRFRFIQSEASDLWIVNHNLGVPPMVDVYNAGSQRIIAELEHTTINQFRVLLDRPLSGFVMYI